MNKNRWIDFSERIYALFLGLYPSAHRDEYGQAMLQLFGDQCRSAFERRGGPGLAALWLRTLFDLGLSAIAEHLSAPGAQLGLLDAIPNKPLPWKGVGLVLVPGLLLFSAQVAQLAGKSWVFTVLTRVPYLLMVPVLLVWLITRKYPVWGLIPLGLLCSNVVYYASRFNSWQFEYGAYPSFLRQIGLTISSFKPVAQSLKIWMVSQAADIWLAVAFLVAAALFIIVRQHRGGVSRAIWIWLGAYVLFSIVLVNFRIQNYMDSINYNAIYLYDSVTTLWGAQAGGNYALAHSMVRFWTLYGSGAFLLLILAGILLVRRYGDLAILLPLGYGMGRMVYGFNYEDQQLYLVMGGVLLYHTLIALVAPIWIARSSGSRRLWAMAVSIALAFTTLIVFRETSAGYIAALYQSGNEGMVPVTLLNRLAMIIDPLVVVAGLGLAILLYRQALPAATPAVLLSPPVERSAA